MDTAGDRTIFEYLSFHIVYSAHRVMISNVVLTNLLIVDSRTIVKSALTCGRWRPRTVTALINRCEISLEVVGYVLHARAVHKALSVSVPVNHSRVSTVARAACLCVNNDLGIDANRCSCTQLIQDVEPISDSRCTALRPARSTILRNMLVFVP